MRQFFSSILSGSLLFLGLSLGALTPSSPLRAEIVVADFEEPALASKLTDDVYKGELGAPGSFNSGNVSFSNDGHYIIPPYDFWSGIGFARKTTLSTGEYWENGNDLVITPGTGAGGSDTWGVVYFSGTLQTQSGYVFDSLAISNTVYTSYVMTHDDTYGGPAFSQGDYFTVTFTNPVTHDSLDYYLADYRSSNPSEHYILNDWTNVSVSSLQASTLNVSFNGSRQTTDPNTNQVYLNTPTYVAIDNVAVSSVSAVPEPSSLALLAASGSLGVWFRWRKRRRLSSSALSAPPR